MNFSKHWAATLDDYAIDLAWSPDGKFLAAASAAGGVSIFDAAGTLVHKLAGHDNGANCLAWMPDASPVGSALAQTDDRGARKHAPYGGLLATGGQDGKVKLWNGITGARAHEIQLGDDWVEHLGWASAILPVGPALAQADAVGARKHAPYHTPLLFATAGKKLTALRPDGSIAHAFPDAPKTITALALNSQHSTLSSSHLAVAYFGGVCVWDATTFASHKEFLYGNTIHALTWSPDGRWLVAGCQDNAVHLWAPAEDLELHMSGYETKLKELSFSRDSKWLATGGGRDACVWDCTGAGPEGREPLMLPHQARVVATAFQHQHSLVATGAADGEFCLWSPTRKNPLIAEVKLPAAATKFAWSPDDTLLAIGTEKGSVFVFKFEN